MRQVIVICGPLSFRPGSEFFLFAQQMRRTLSLLADIVNRERGGLRVSGKRMAVLFKWVDDASDVFQVTNATASALRGAPQADFAVAPWSSGLTSLASLQSAADGVLMMSGTASLPSIYTQNNLTFGVIPATPTIHNSALAAIVDAAIACDRAAARGSRRVLRHHDGVTLGELPPSLYNPSVPCFGGGGCMASLRLGFIQADSTFTRAQCSMPAELAAPFGMPWVKCELPACEGGVGTIYGSIAEVNPDLIAEQYTQMKAVLAELQRLNVTVLVGCTYELSAELLAKALMELDYAPLSVSTSVSVSSWGEILASTGPDHRYFYRYILGATPWHRSRPNRGSWTNLTSEEFVGRYIARYRETPVYQAIAPVGAIAALFAAIEMAGSIVTAQVVDVLETLSLDEFYANSACARARWCAFSKAHAHSRAFA